MIFRISGGNIFVAMRNGAVEHINRPDFGPLQLKSPDEVQACEGRVLKIKTRIPDGWNSESVFIERVIYDVWAWVKYPERNYPDATITTPLSLWSIVPIGRERWVTDTYLEDPQRESHSPS